MEGATFAELVSMRLGVNRNTEMRKNIVRFEPEDKIFLRKYAIVIQAKK